jgi:ornithine cyclodeaminase
MRIFDAAQTDRLLSDAALIEAIAALFRTGAELPLRHHHTIETGGTPATLLLMPAWSGNTASASQRHIGIKIVTVFPDNGARDLPAVYGQYLLLSAETGQALALFDGTVLTRRRTACASALASRFLSRPDAMRLLMVGTGALAPHLIRAHAAVRPIREVAIWGRSPDKARALVARFNGGDLALPGVTAFVADDIAHTIAMADIISCATLAREPLIEGAWLGPGQHLDLVGGFTPAMREADDQAVRRAQVFVDTRQGACAEAGDIVQPLRSGALQTSDIQADLFELCRGQHRGRTSAAQITLFKSVGTALEDLAAAELAYAEAGGRHAAT